MGAAVINRRFYKNAFIKISLLNNYIGMIFVEQNISILLLFKPKSTHNETNHNSAFYIFFWLISL